MMVVRPMLFGAALALPLFIAVLAAQDAADHRYDDRTENPAPPAALDVRSLRWSADKAREGEAALERLDHRARLGDALVDRFLAPFDAWCSQADVTVRGRCPMDAKREAWYCLVIRAENVHRGETIYFRFPLRPTDRRFWKVTHEDGTEDYYLDQDGQPTRVLMDEYAREQVRPALAGALGRYLSELDAGYFPAATDPAAADPLVEFDRWQGYRETLRTGSARLYALPTADFDARRLTPDMEIK